MAGTVPFARVLDAIPIVPTTAYRNAFYPSTTTINQRVHNLETGNIEKWNGTTWDIDFDGASAPGAPVQHGTGSPEGVVTAGLGGIYQQTDGANGAVLWKKNLAPTTTTGWALLPTTSQVFNVKDYGAKGDGTTDDTTAIQSALTASGAASGGVVYLPTGTYLITSALAVKAFTTLAGAGAGASTILCQKSTPLIWVEATAQDHVSFRDFKIDCQGGGTIGHSALGFNTGSNYGTVERCWIVGVGQYGIVVRDLATSGGGGGHQFRHNLIDMSAAVDANSPIGIEIFPKGGAGFLATPGALVEGNTLIDSGTGCRSGIKLDQNLGGRIIGNSITGVRSSSATGAITGTGNRDHLILGNSINDTQNGITVSGNLAADNGLANSNVTVQANVITTWANVGIFASQGLDGLQLLGNILDLNGGAGVRAIRLDMTAAGVDYTALQIRNNTLTGAVVDLRSDGTNVFGFPRAQVTGNTVAGGIAPQISVAGLNSADVVLADNLLFHSTTGAGVINVINSPPRVRVLRNRLLDCNTTAVAGSIGLNIFSPNAEVRDNHIENISGGTGSLHTGIVLNTGAHVVCRDNRIIAMLTATVTLSGGATLAGPGTMSADRGDTGISLTVWQDAEYQMFATALTANRTITLTTTDAFDGAQFRIVRTGLGNFTLAVGALYTFPANVGGTVTVAFRAGAWQLSGIQLLVTPAPLASPALTGTPTAPTATANTNTTQLATTAYVDRASGAATATSASPAGTTSTTAVMMAVGGAATPTKGTKMMLSVMGQMANSTLNDGAVVQLRYGTGTAPVNGAAVTGTLVGISQTAASLVAAQKSGFCIIAEATGLTLGTAIWFDVALNAVTAGTATVTGVTASAWEVA